MTIFDPGLFLYMAALRDLHFRYMSAKAQTRHPPTKVCIQLSCMVSADVQVWNESRRLSSSSSAPPTAFSALFSMPLSVPSSALIVTLTRSVVISSRSEVQKQVSVTEVYVRGRIVKGLNTTVQVS